MNTDTGHLDFHGLPAPSLPKDSFHVPELKGCCLDIHSILSHFLDHQPSLWRNPPEKKGWPFCLTCPAAFEMSQSLQRPLKRPFGPVHSGGHTVPTAGRGPKAPLKQGGHLYSLRRAPRSVIKNSVIDAPPPGNYFSFFQLLSPIRGAELRHSKTTRPGP